MSLSPQNGFDVRSGTGSQSSTSSSRPARTFGLDINAAVWSPSVMVVAFALALVLAWTFKVPALSGERLRDFVG
jgi:hypothetical protein